MHGHSHHHGAHHVEHDAHGDTGLGQVFALNVGFLVVEVAAAWLTGSLALMADAVHMTSDVVALALAWFAARQADPTPGPGWAFGGRRVPILAAFANGLTLTLAAVWIVAEAAHRLWGGVAPEHPAGILVVGGLGLAINLGSAWVLARQEHGDLNTRAALWHMLGDALGSVAAMAAAIGVGLGATWVDPAASALLAVVIAGGSWSILRESGEILVDHDDAQVAEHLLAHARASAGVTDVRELRVWRVDGSHRVALVRVVGAETARETVTHALLGHDDVGEVWVTVEPGAGA